MSATIKQVYPPCPKTERGKPTHIGGDPKNKNDIVYCCGQVVVVRNVNDPTQCYLYTSHQNPVTVARYSPNGYYIASADSSGLCKVWDTVNPEHVCTLERAVVDTPMDMDWSDDSKRVVVVGQGRNKMGDAFFTDSGAAVGTISGHQNPIMSCSIRKTRPFRLATGSEDRKVNIYPGPPFNFESSITKHSKYVNCVRYSPDGSKLLTVGGDKLVCLFDGKTSEPIIDSEGKESHSGSIYSACWDENSTRFITAGADKTAKIWDAETLDVLQTFSFPNTVDNFQVGSLWQGNNLLTVNLRGDITYLDESNPEQPLRVLHGHPRRIISLEMDRETNNVYTTDATGYSIQWQEGTADTRAFEQNIIDGAVTSRVHGGLLYIIGVEGALAAGSLETLETVGKVEFGVLPVAFDVTGDLALVALENNTVLFINNFEVVGEQDLGFLPTAIRISPDGTKVAVGGNDENPIVYVYNLKGNSLELAYQCKKHQRKITCLDWSPDSTLLASGGADRYVYCWEGDKLKVNKWVFHSSPLICVSWNPNGKYVVSGGLDCSIFVWSLERPMKKIKVQNAHLGSVNGVAWANETTALSCGDDGAVIAWDVTFH
eukprot:TRINITY_DN1155_c0_g1_i1.p1 TRINITY_DN1155_c0_g1~~TRINITY_DN1155_c0_g1_i1.p1  ORF type:complete len:600 (-),score=158.67 TRINITY_DN1155_c0_g1_i1:33-1832(-)